MRDAKEKKDMKLAEVGSRDNPFDCHEQIYIETLTTQVKLLTLQNSKYAFWAEKKLLDKLMTYMIHEFLNHMVTKWNMISNSFMQITHFVFLVLFLLIYECVERFFLSRNLNLAMLFVIDMCCHLSVESAISFSIWMNKTNLMRWESFFFNSKTNGHA